MFKAPFRWEWHPEAGTSRPASECLVWDANDELVASCITDLHAAELCERLNRSEPLSLRVNTQNYTATMPIKLIG